MAAADASIAFDAVQCPWRRRMTWVLRITVFLQAVGNWRAMTALNSSPLFELLWLPADAGGFEWLEADALFAQQIVGWVTLACGLLTLVRPCLLFTGPLVVLQVVLTVAMWRGDMGYPLAGIWPDPDVKRLFPFPTQALRMATPLALVILDPWLPRLTTLRDTGGRVRAILGANLLRLASAVTFVAHGIEAGQHNSQFIDLLIDSTRRVLGLALSEAAAGQALTFIALHDLAVAGLCLVCRSRLVMGWMAVWGLLTAVSRIIAHGWTSGLHEALIRAPHIGGPLAVVLIWQLLRHPSPTN